MKLEHIDAAKKASNELWQLEANKQTITSARSVSVNFACCTLQLGDYEDPSPIGGAYRATKKGVLAMVERQIEACRAELVKLGVTP